jgi:hypothetical protein
MPSIFSAMMGKYVAGSLCWCWDTRGVATRKLHTTSAWPEHVTDPAGAATFTLEKHIEGSVDCLIPIHSNTFLLFKQIHGEHDYNEAHAISIQVCAFLHRWTIYVTRVISLFRELVADDSRVFPQVLTSQDLPTSVPVPFPRYVGSANVPHLT